MYSTVAFYSCRNNCNISKEVMHTNAIEKLGERMLIPGLFKNDEMRLRLLHDNEATF